VVGALVRVAGRLRGEADVAAFLAEFREFLVKEWSRYLWATLLAGAEYRSVRQYAGSRCALMVPERLLGRAPRKFRYRSPVGSGYTAELEITDGGSQLLIYCARRGWSIREDLSKGVGLANAVVEVYAHRLGTEPLEGLSRAASSKGVREVAWALEAAADLYRASEPYIAAELASDPGEPPEWLKEHLVSEALPIAERIAYQLAREYRKYWYLEDAPWRHIWLPGHFYMDVAVAVLQFEDREKLATDLTVAVESYKRARAAKAVLRTALAMGLIE